MKIKFNPTIKNNKRLVTTKFRCFFAENKKKLQSFLKKTFDKKNKVDIFEARKAPNWCQTAEDMPNNAVINLPISFEEFANDCQKLGLNAKDFIIKKS